jgi:hypothetical protein
MSLRKIDNPELFRSNIREKLNDIINNEKNTSNLEKGIFNYTLKEADQRKIVKKWDNSYFVQIYLDDITIVSSSFNEHLNHLTTVFKRLKEYNASY